MKIPSLSQSQSRLSATVFFLILWALVLWQAIDLWRAPAAREGDVQHSFEDLTGATNPAAANPLQPLAEYHLFGAFLPSALSDASIAPTQLPLTLQGIELTLGTAGHLVSRALIAFPGENKTHVYKEGDVLPGGVIVQQILRDAVILSHNGSLERLRMPLPTISKEGAFK